MIPCNYNNYSVNGVISTLNNPNNMHKDISVVLWIILCDYVGNKEVADFTFLTLSSVGII